MHRLGVDDSVMMSSSLIQSINQSTYIYINIYSIYTQDSSGHVEIAEVMVVSDTGVRIDLYEMMG